MTSLHKNPALEWKKINNVDCLCFTFKGTLTHKDALVAIKEWKGIFDIKKNEKIILIWQCNEMKGYEPMARSAWQSTIKELKSQIEVIWLVSNSTIIQAGAKIMSLFTSYDIKYAKSEKDIILNYELATH